MQRVFFGFLVILAVLATKSFAQQPSSKAKAVVIPSDIYLPTVVSQPDCPLRIEKAFVAKMLDGTERMFFEARNIGSKPITFFQVDALVSNGNGVSALFPYRRGQKSVLPGEVAPPGLQQDFVEFVPLTDDLRKKLLLDGKTKAIVIFMVLKIELDDGSTYDATPLFDKIEDHFRLLQNNTAGPFPKPLKIDWQEKGCDTNRKEVLHRRIPLRRMIWHHAMTICRSAKNSSPIKVAAQQHKAIRNHLIPMTASVNTSPATKLMENQA